MPDDMPVDDYKRLWAAVLKQAVRDARQRASKGDVSRQMMTASARAWFESENQDIGSFLWVCAALDVEPRYVKRFLDRINHDSSVLEGLIS